ncbi:MAG: hypothetical protein ACOWWH_07520 [Eubacteriaceae bacterium]
MFKRTKEKIVKEDKNIIKKIDENVFSKSLIGNLQILKRFF